MKTDLESLAIFGGAPQFERKLHVGSPNIGDRGSLLKRINELLDRNWLTNNGPYVQEFERKLAEYIGVKNCIAMCNGTIALEIAIRALGLTGEVIVPSFTFIATAHALQWQEITPVFCDIDAKTLTLDTNCLEKMITPHTTGIIGVHLWGRSCDIDEIAKIAKRRNLRLLFDAAHAFGCSYKGRIIGSFGDAEIFSFHATKFFNTFEGGAVATNNDELAAKIRLMKNFGFSGYDNVIYIGTNGKMTEVSAAMGLTGLENLGKFVAVNHRNYKRYEQELESIPGVRMIKVASEREKCNYQYIIVEVDEAVLQMSRDQLAKILRAENILARRYFYPGIHNMEPYRSYYPHARLLLPETERLAHRVLSLPTGTAIEESDISGICEIMRFAAENGAAVSQRLKALSVD